MSDQHAGFPADGRCTCGEVRYRVQRPPMFVHCCHCSWCQRETGSAFALNALVEADCVQLVAGVPERVELPTNSGLGQGVLRCPRCQVALWSHYGAARERVAFVRVGTLEQPALCPPDIHVYTTTRLPWVALPADVPAVPEFYRRSEYWPQEAYRRYQAAVGR